MYNKTFTLYYIILALPSFAVLDPAQAGLAYYSCQQSYEYFNFCLNFFYVSWPANQDVKPKDYLNKGGRVTVFALTKETPLICAVEQLANYLDSLNINIVIKVDNHFLDDVTCAFEKTSIKDRVSFSSLIFFHLNYIAHWRRNFG